MPIPLLAITHRHDTLNSTYNEKKYVEILLHYRWLFIRGNVFIGEWHVFGAEVFLRYSQFFIKGNFIIGRVECTCIQKQMSYVLRCLEMIGFSHYCFIKMVGSKQILNFKLPLLSFPSTSARLLIHGVVSCTDFRTTLSILSISC